MFKHILLPTDGSDVALRAVDIGIALAATLGARVYAFHVAPPFPAVTYFAQMIQLPESSYTDRAEERAKDYLADVSDRARVAGVPCEGSYVFDYRPYCAMLGAAAKQSCDLIVMGTHGARGMDRLLLGSETHKVILSGDIPVLVCR